MSGRLPTGLRVSAVVRAVNAVGGSATVIARGDADAGALLVLAGPPGGAPALYEASPLGDVAPGVGYAGPTGGDAEALEDYCRRRRARDPDLWIVELIVADAARFAVESLRSN